MTSTLHKVLPVASFQKGWSLVRKDEKKVASFPSNEISPPWKVSKRRLINIYSIFSFKSQEKRDGCGRDDMGDWQFLISFLFKYKSTSKIFKSHKPWSDFLILHRNGKWVYNANYESGGGKEGGSIDQPLFISQIKSYFSEAPTILLNPQGYYDEIYLFSNRELSRVGTDRVQGSVLIWTKKQPGNKKKFDRVAKDKIEIYQYLSFFPFWHIIFSFQI